MDTGTKISGIGHLVLIGVAVFGGAFRSEPLPMQVQEVSVVTSEEFAAMMAAQRPPETAALPVAPAPPGTAPETPAVAVPGPEPETAPATPPEATPAPEVEDAPERLPEPLPPQPETEAVDTAPAIQPPEDIESPLPPESLARPEPRPADRVAPQPMPAPPEQTLPDEIARPDTAPDPGAEDPQPRQEAAAPEEATDRIAPETSDSASLAPAASIRPPASRPSRPAPADTVSEDAVNAALAEALAGTDDPDDAAPGAAPVPSGPPMTQGERDDLVFAVSRCWNVGSLSTEALATTVVVGVEMTEEATPVAGSIRLIGYSGGSESAAQQAFQTARRAIIRCGAGGYGLPPEKYGQWRDIEMTFNPERMRIR